MNGAYQVRELPADLDPSHTTTIDLNGAHSKADLMAAVKRDLGLHDHFGANWDALADILTDLDSDTLVIVGADHLEALVAETLGEILTDLTESEFGPARALVHRRQRVKSLVARRS